MGTEEDGKANAKKTKKRKKLQSLSRGEKVKSTMKLDGPERRESTSTRLPLLARIA